MSQLWTPPKVRRELQETTAEHNSAVLSMFELQYGILDKWNRELKKIDPLLRLGRAKEKAHAPGVEPGFYHLIRINPGAPIWVQPLHDGQGNFVEPTSRMLDLLRASDLQNTAAVRAREAEDAAQVRAVEKAKEDGHEERVDTMMEHWRASSQVRIPFRGLERTGWSQAVAGRRGVKR